MTVMYRPMGDKSWQRPAGDRRSSQFSAEWKDTLKLLAREVELLGGEDITIELDVLPGAIRVDSLGLKANQTPLSPAVVVSFETEHGTLVYRNDALDSPAYSAAGGWRHNVRGVALTLERLRDIERYGASDRGQQYAGYAALPAGSGGVPLGGMTRDQAVAVLAEAIAVDVRNLQTDPDSLRRALRRARKVAHPDVSGDRFLWDDLEQAASVLGIDS
ncbi:hypothetical protein ASD11_01405 [Aeromicrobium sp. Root495]|uniref:hypothetical protein n=1 Tax=Aeromicrobium sp. Root495 TaxID=1736550 RepID=UPI0006FE1C7C|nr:hypothetical protein [Aeromicrobium sp. Root495]KQY58352.1 hypothetical protein ASD11_01405 [Aeromicrobium sp. Root495]